EDHGQPGRDQEQRRHPDRAVLPRVPAAAADAALPDVPVEADRVAAEGEQQHRAGAEREDDGEERAHADVHGAVGETRPLRRPRRRQRHLAADGLRAHTDTAPPTEAWPLLTVPGTVKTEARKAPPRRVFTVPGMVKRRVRR